MVRPSGPVDACAEADLCRTNREQHTQSFSMATKKRITDRPCCPIDADVARATSPDPAVGRPLTQGFTVSPHIRHKTC